MDCCTARNGIINMLNFSMVHLLSSIIIECPHFQVFISTRTDGGNYHKEMNSIVLMKWWENIVVLDNASYHNALTDDTKASNSNHIKA